MCLAKTILRELPSERRINRGDGNEQPEYISVSHPLLTSYTRHPTTNYSMTTDEKQNAEYYLVESYLTTEYQIVGGDHPQFRQFTKIILLIDDSAHRTTALVPTINKTAHYQRISAALNAIKELDLPRTTIRKLLTHAVAYYEYDM